jgi:large subunit ribosomal protein L14e
MFNRFVEAGRFCLITYGPDCGKTCVIVDIIDGNRVVVDGPKDVNGMFSNNLSLPLFSVGVERQQIPIRWLSLTDFHVPIGRGASTPVLKEAFSKSGVVEAWKKTAWAKKLANREAKKSLTDFDRFRVMVAKKRVSHAVNTEMKKVKKTVSKRK